MRTGTAAPPPPGPPAGQPILRSHPASRCHWPSGCQAHQPPQFTRTATTTLHRFRFGSTLGSGTRAAGDEELPPLVRPPRRSDNPNTRGQRRLSHFGTLYGRPPPTSAWVPNLALRRGCTVPAELGHAFWPGRPIRGMRSSPLGPGLPANLGLGSGLELGSGQRSLGPSETGDASARGQPISNE